MPLCCAQSSYISGIAQGANVDKSWVSIVGVTTGTSVTVNTQAGPTNKPDLNVLPALQTCQSTLMCMFHAAGARVVHAVVSE